LLIGQYVFKRNLLRSLMKAQMELPDKAWSFMLHSWAAFFSAMGVVNLWVAFHFDTETWVNFKLFGGIGLMLVFVLLQAAYLSRYMKEDSSS